MTMFTNKSFSVGAPASKQYQDNWERTFRGGNSANRRDEECCVDPKDKAADGSPVVQGEETEERGAASVCVPQGEVQAGKV